MQDPFASHREELDITPGQRVKGTVSGLFRAMGSDFPTSAVEELPLTFDGIPDDFHAGPTRKSGGREPWYPRGTVIRNERQVSILAPDELRTVAKRLDLPEVKPEWMGANMIVDGVSDLTMLPPRTLLFFEGGVTIKIDGDNGPCRVTGREIASHFEGRQDVELNFAKVAQHLRGLVGWVEKPGTIRVGEAFEARIPPQWIYSTD